MRDAGEPLVIRLSATVLRRAEPAILLSLEDVSENKRREQKLQLTERLLHDAERRLEALERLLSEAPDPTVPAGDQTTPAS
jgi:hypothetical protein